MRKSKFSAGFAEDVDMPEYNYKGPRFQLVKEF